MDLLPPLKVLGTQQPVVVQESLGHHGVGGVDHRVVHLGDEGGWDGTVISKEILVIVDNYRRETLAIPVVWAGPEFQHCSDGLNVIGGNRPMHGGGAVFCPVVEDSATVDQSHHHSGRAVTDARDQREGRLWNGDLTFVVFVFGIVNFSLYICS